MRKTFGVGAVALLATLALSLGPAHADVAVTIDQVEGTTLLSLPALPAEYPGDVPTYLTGTAAFNTGRDEAGEITGSVGVLLRGGSAPIGGAATLTCDAAGTTCTWKFRVPFFITPGEYQVFATAADLDETVVHTPCNPDPEVDPTCVGRKVTIL